MISVSINSDKLDTQERKLKAYEIDKEMELILNSAMFADKILGLYHTNGELSDWKMKSNQAILAHIMSGSEDLSPEVDNELDIMLDDYYTFKKVIGMTYANSPYINVNTKYFDSNDLSAENHHRKQSGSNFLHEYGHKLGFAHDFSSTSRRPNSLCYLLNTIYEECWDALVAPKLTPVKTSHTYRKWFKTYTVVRLELHGSL